jgi:arginine:ornithine antiporter/lysine permease
MRFRKINILEQPFSPQECNGKETGPERPDRTGFKLNAGRWRIQFAAKYGGRRQPSALLIGWAITGVGILFLAFAMLLLTRIRPDLDGGIFTYAREGFGELIGFCSAWGYWLCAVIANVSYLVIVFSALSFFTDTPELRLFGDGNTWQSIVGASVLLWFVHFLVLRGVQTAAGINLVATLAKLVPLGAVYRAGRHRVSLDTFRLDFSGLALGVPVWEQVKNTMLITLWVFIGVEGAVVVSARAQ